MSTPCRNSKQKLRGGVAHMPKAFEPLNRNYKKMAVAPHADLTKEYVSIQTLCDHVADVRFMEECPDEIRSFL